MNYAKIYDQLVEKCKPRGLDKSSVDYYTEIHHIVPRCMGGSDLPENLVMFTGREHFLSHMLLWKAYPEELSLMRAAFMMSSRYSMKISSRVYADLREQYAEAVRVQCSGEGNPFYGKQHSPETLYQISKSKQIFQRKKNLLNWKNTQNKYMIQFDYKKDIFQISLEDAPDSLGKESFNKKMTKDSENLWYCAEHIRDYWNRSGKPGRRLLLSELAMITDLNPKAHELLTLVKKFQTGWMPSEDSSWMVFALNNSNKSSLAEKVKLDLKETFSEIKSNFFSSWLEDREHIRVCLEEVISKLGIVAGKNVSINKLSLVDVAEAIILWKSDLVEQKQIAALLGVKRNTISNVVENETRWKPVKEHIKDIEDYLIDRHYCTSLNSSGVISYNS